MTATAAPIQRARAYVRVARTDSLVRNSLFMMLTTVATAVLGYVFWIVAVRVCNSADVGIASAVISLCSIVALFTYVGPAAMLIERLHAYERSRAWAAFLAQTCALTAVATGIVAALVIPVIARSKSYGSFFSAAGAAALAVLGAVAWTLVNMYGSAFIAARRADGLFAVQGICSLFKVLLLVPLCAGDFGALGIVVAWVASSVFGVAAGAFWLLPRLRLGKPERRTKRWRRRVRRARAHHARVRHARAHHSRAPRRPRRGDYAWHLVGQHLTSVGGQVTPLILPVLVVLRLGEGQNGYFYITWMIGSVFFMVSPSISSALFAESVRIGSVPLLLPGDGQEKSNGAGQEEEGSLRATVAKAFRVISFLLLPAMAGVVAGGRLILGLFGHAYASAGYGLLILLAISAVPDAVSNVAVAVCRATGRLGYSAGINLGILVVTAASVWCLMPRYGLLGVGAGWLAAQVLGALASIPAFLRLRGGAAA